MEDERKLMVTEMSWLRGILGKSNEKEYAMKINNTREDGTKKPKIDKIKKRRLTFFGHVTRMENGRLPIMALYIAK